MTQLAPSRPLTAGLQFLAAYSTSNVARAVCAPDKDPQRSILHAASRLQTVSLPGEANLVALYSAGAPHRTGGPRCVETAREQSGGDGALLA